MLNVFLRLTPKAFPEPDEQISSFPDGQRLMSIFIQSPTSNVNPIARQS